MNKINFNVPFLDIEGNPAKTERIDPRLAKIGPQGQIIPYLVRNDAGEIQYDEINFRKVLVTLLTEPYEEDGKMPFDDRVKRGNLARKIQKSSTTAYRPSDLQMLKDLAAKTKSTLVLLQLQDLIDGPDANYAVEADEKADEPAASAAETAAPLAA